MLNAIKLVPLSYVGFSASVLIAQTPDIPVMTAATALIGGFTLLLSTLVWIVKKQQETNTEQRKEYTAALATQQKECTAALAAQQKSAAESQQQRDTIFATMLDKVREDHHKTLKLLTAKGE